MPNVYPQDTFKIIIANNDVTRFVKEFSIASHLYGGASTFEAKIEDFDVNLTQQVYDYWVFINGKNVQNGFLDSFNVRFNENEGTERKVQGRDAIQILMDNDCLYDTEYNDATIDEIFDQLLYGLIGTTLSSGFGKYPSSLISQVYLQGSYYPSKNLLAQNGGITNLFFGAGYRNFSLSYSSKAQELLQYKTPKEYRFSYAKPTFGESIFDFLSKLLNQIGLLIRHVPDQPLSGQAAYGSIFYIDTYLNPGPGPVINNYQSFDNISKNNIASMDFTESTKDFYTFVKLVGNAAHEEEGKSDVPTPTSKVPTPYNSGTQKSWLKSEALALYTDPNPKKAGSIDLSQLPYQGLKKFKASTVDCADVNTWTNYADRLINNVMITQGRKLYDLKYKLTGWAPWGSSIPFLYNTLATVNDEILGFNNTSMLISDVTYDYSLSGGAKTTLELHNFYVFSDYGLRNTL